MNASLNIVVLGLSLSSSWGNGHATTYRSLLRGLHAQGHKVLFLERTRDWYAANCDLPDPDFCTLEYYDSLNDLGRFKGAIVNADVVLIGSYVPEGGDVIDQVAALKPRVLCFYDIDTPVTMSRLDNYDEEYLRRRQIPLFDVYFSFSGGPVLGRLEDRYGATRAAVLYCSVDPAKYYPITSEIEWDLGYLGTYSPDRQPALERLLIEPARRLPECRFVVAGSQFPTDIDWPRNVERIEHLPSGQHADFYTRQRFTLNVTRADMVAAGWSPSVRLFEAAACATPVISDRWNGLHELLPDGRALLIADETGDVLDALTGLSESSRRTIARNARDRVLARHTGEARARELVSHVLPHLCAGPSVQPTIQKHLSRETVHESS